MSDRESQKVNTAKHSKCEGDQDDVAGALIKLVHLLAEAAAKEILAGPVEEGAPSSNAPTHKD